MLLHSVFFIFLFALKFAEQTDFYRSTKHESWPCCPQLPSQVMGTGVHVALPHCRPAR